MRKVCRYSFYDIIRSKWLVSYTAFFFILSVALFWLTPDFSKVMVSIMNIILVLVPLVATMFGIMYFYNAREFTELLLSQPLRRRDIFLGQYLAVAGSLSCAFLFGVGIPFIFFGIFRSPAIFNFASILLIGVMLSFIFSAISFLIALRNENKIKGFGVAIFVWLFFAIIYDGLFILLLSFFSDYPLENVALAGIIGNPIDLSRILILLKLDISVLLGYTGAVFHKALGASAGILTAFSILLAWIVVPVWRIVKVSSTRDY
jgi:Cu-processing system permease protein